METLEEALLTYPFDCGSTVVHGVCEGCKTSLEERELLSCPVCRAPSLTIKQPGLEPDATGMMLGLMEAHAEVSRATAAMMPPDLTTSALVRNLQATVAVARDLFNRPAVLPEEFRNLLRE